VGVVQQPVGEDDTHLHIVRKLKMRGAILSSFDMPSRPNTLRRCMTDIAKEYFHQSF
jgi:hypothetical protein